MKFIRDTIVRSVVVYVMIYVWQIVKMWFAGEIDPTLTDVVLSGVVGWFLSGFILKRMR